MEAYSSAALSTLLYTKKTREAALIDLEPAAVTAGVWGQGAYKDTGVFFTLIQRMH